VAALLMVVGCGVVKDGKDALTCDSSEKVGYWDQEGTAIRNKFVPDGPLTTQDFASLRVWRDSLPTCAQEDADQWIDYFRNLHKIEEGKRQIPEIK
jgi:hypothetical protein